jgi:hypothetical protein
MSGTRMSALALTFAMFTGGFVKASGAWQIHECAFISASSPRELGTLGATCMSQGERRVPPERLDADTAVISKAYNELAASNAQTGVKDERILQKFAATWSKYRWENQRTTLQSLVLITGSGYGRLTVKSKPSGATVNVNNGKWNDATDTSQCTPEGTKEIVLKKERCSDEKGSITVTAAKEEKFERKLQCKS